MWVTVAVGLLASLALLAVGRGIDHGRDRLRDDAARVAAASALRAQFDVAESQVRDIAGLFAASRRVESHEYRAFAAPMLERSDANSFIYLTHVEGDRRAAYERASGVRITERGPDGAPRPAGRRDRYLVVTYVALDGDGRNLEGLDVLGLPGRRALVDRAARTGEVAISPQVKLSSSDEPGLLVIAPVYEDGRLEGVVSGAFRDSVLVGAVRHALRRNVGLRVTNADAVLGTQGTVPADAERTRIAYGGQELAVAVAAPHPGLRFGPLALALGALLTALAVILQNASRTRRRLAAGEARFADAFEASPVGQGLASHAGVFDRVNPALCSITGHAAEELVARTAAALVHPADRERADALMARALATPGVAVGAEVRLLTADGGGRWAQMHFTRLSDGPLLTQVIDVSERRGLEVELRHQAEHDQLTELLNRRGFQRRLGALLEHGRASGAVMLIDLDHFKAVNDTLGHHVGDQVIHAAGAALRSSLRADDIVARIGGDEFAVLLPGADLERAQATAQRLVEAVEFGVEHGVTASVGVAMLDGSLTTADSALMAADLAMYDAKHEGRRRTAFYDGGSESSTHARLQWVDRIRTALAEERLALLAQPIMDLDTGRVHHEILLRMLAPDGELIAPDAFLPIAEQFGLMGEIDRWVATRAIEAIVANPERDLVFEVNLSGSSLGSPELLEAIRGAMVGRRPRPRDLRDHRDRRGHEPRGRARVRDRAGRARLPLRAR